jgi:hypothetical protein
MKYIRFLSAAALIAFAASLVVFAAPVAGQAASVPGQGYTPLLWYAVSFGSIFITAGVVLFFLFRKKKDGSKDNAQCRMHNKGNFPQ